MENVVLDKAADDAGQAAASAGLVYVTDAEPGFTRRRAGKSFAFYGLDGRRITDPGTVERIRKLAIPPAYREVWICPDPLGHLQATGRDAKGRKQYRYHPDFRAVREGTKYQHMFAFAAALPGLRATIDAHMRLRGLQREKVLATIVHLLETTMIRVGNEDYARQNESYGLTTLRPSNAYAFVSPAMLPTVNRSLHDTNFGFNRAFAPAMSAMVITNNIKVSAVAVAGGVTAGILTVSVIAYNGMMVGTLAALFARRGLGGDFWATIAPHGVIELTAIHIAGAAGLLLAAGILRPGRLRRGDAFARNARRAGTLMLGVAAMLVVAGTIEGFVSPQRLPGPVRVGVGVVTGLALLAYFAFAGTSGTASERSALLDRDVGVEDARA